MPKHPIERFSIRPAGASDAGPIAACIEDAFRPYVARIGKTPRPMLRDYREVLDTHPVWVAEVRDAVAGVLVLDRTEEGFKLDTVAVVPEHQGRGLGRELMRLAEAEAIRAGYASINLSTLEEMTENRMLYEKNGYQVFDRRVEKGYTRIFMRKHLR